MAIDVPAMLAGHAQTVSRLFDGLIDPRQDAAEPWHVAPPRLIEAIRYSFDVGGKRLRPALVLETFDAVASTHFVGDRFRKAERQTTAHAAALAIELVHTFSLVHDDLPAMDDDDLRRGRPTNHKVFGEAMAILAGDAMLAMAFELLGNCGPAGAGGLTLVIELARATGPAGMIGGQVLDMAGEGQQLDLNGLRAIHRLKTGALLTTACRLGALAAGAGDKRHDPAADETILNAVTAYGRHLGLAFQIVDDILDETSTPEQLGKATNKDAGRGKNTYPRLLGLDGAKRAAAEQIDAAAAALEPLGRQGDRMADIARFVTARGV